MASLADSEAQRRLALERELVTKTEESGDLCVKDRWVSREKVVRSEIRGSS